MTLSNRVDALRAMASRATPGPWDAHAGTIRAHVSEDLACPLFESLTPTEFGKGRSYDQRFADAWRQEMNNLQYLVALRNTALSLIEELAGEVERLREALRPFANATLMSQSAHIVERDEDAIHVAFASGKFVVSALFETDAGEAFNAVRAALTEAGQ